MKQTLIVVFLIPLIFGFLFWGSSSGAFFGFRSVNKVITPQFAPAFAGPAFSLSFQPVQPSFPALPGAFAFRWNFFDP